MNLSVARSELTTYPDERMTHRRVPGAVIGIVHGEEELIVVRGVTSVDHPLEVDATTLFQVGSRTKTFTATALMRQREAGKLDLDAPLVSYLPEFRLANPDYAGRVTPRHLLTHTGGWLGDYFLAVPLRGRGEDSLARLVDVMERPPCLTAPGEIFSYNNAGFCVAGRLLEVLTGEPPLPIRLGFYDRDCIFALDEPAGSRGRFLRDAEGRIQHLHHGGRLTPRFQGGESLETLLATASEPSGNE